MIFQYTWRHVLDDTKTLTHRLVKPGDELRFVPRGPWQIRQAAVMRGNRTIYSVTQPRSVQPGRGLPTIYYTTTTFEDGRIEHCEVAGPDSAGLAQPLRIRIIDIHRADVRAISEQDVRDEGFESKLDYLCTWCLMHDKAWYRRALEALPQHAGQVSPAVDDKFFAMLSNRPSSHYDAWAISFRRTVDR